MELLSPVFNLSGTTSPQVSFWLHSFRAYPTSSFATKEFQIDVMASDGTTLIANDVLVKGDLGTPDWHLQVIDMSSYINSGDIRLLFRVLEPSSANGNHDIAIDDFQITADCQGDTFTTVRDEFSDQNSYNSNDGTTTWSGAWTETGDDGQSNFSTFPGGNIGISSANVLYFQGPSVEIVRSVNLTNVAAATLRFYSGDSSTNTLTLPASSMAAGMELYVEVHNGSAWNLVHTITTANLGSQSLDISSLLNSGGNTQIRFRTNSSGSWGSRGGYVDNVEIDVTAPACSASTTEFITNAGADATTYNAADQVCVRVTDSDEAGQGPLSVSVTGGTPGTQTLSLAETLGGGVFEGCFPASFFSGGDSLTANYTDDDDGTDTSNDAATVNANTFDLALQKRAGDSQSLIVNPNESVVFTIEIFNQGQSVVSNIELVDYIPTYLTLSDANWTDNGNGTASHTIAGPTAAGASATVDIQFTVDANAPAGQDLDNYAEIVSAIGGTDADSTFDNNPNNDGTVIDNALDSSTGDFEDDHDIEHLGVYTPPVVCDDSGTIVGTTFRYYDADGIQDALESDLSGILVTAYDNTNTAIISDTTAADGTYTLTSLCVSERVRVEFSGWPSYLQPDSAGSDSDTSVTFATPTAVNVDLGLNNPADYCQANPTLATSCYLEDAQVNETGDVFVSFPYDAGCADDNLNGTCDDGSNPRLPTPTHLASAQEIGTTWGQAYDNVTDSIFVAAFMKRHAGFRANGETGVIYRINGASVGGTSVVPYVDLDALGFDTGTDPHPADSASNSLWERDSNSWDAVGKLSFGDLDISDDKSTLWTVNLFDKQVYAIPVQSAPVTAGDITTYSLPEPANCPASATNFRPFATGFNDGQVYVGAVCTGETTQSTDDLHAYLFVMDPSAVAPAFTQVFSFDLDYPRTCATGSDPQSKRCACGSWNPWTPTFKRISTGFGGEYIYPQPWLTDIEFDHGDLILGVRDRYSDQMGYKQKRPNSNSNFLYTGNSAGDTLRACADGAGGWTLENNAQCGSITTGAFESEAGPGGKEYYYEDHYPDHQEVSLGGLAQVPGFSDVALTAFDIIYSQREYNDNGILWFNNSQGDRSNHYLVFSTTNNGSQPGTFAKAGGLGDLEALCFAPPIELGNFVWVDIDSDGIRDPDESPLSGVQVGFYDGGGTLLATATTDANGEYYFIGNDHPNAGSVGTNYDEVAAAIDPNPVYEIRIDLSQTALAGYVPTVQDYNANVDNGDFHDSDGDSGAINAGFSTIQLTTGLAGYNDHTYDFGFSTLSIGDMVWIDNGAGTGIANNGIRDDLEHPRSGVQVSLLDAGGAVVDTMVTGADGMYLFTGLTPGDYTVRIDPENFQTGGTLAGYYSSAVTEANPNTDINNDDNGIDPATVADYLTNGVSSGVMTLTAGGEPTDDGDSVANTNLSIDFGFIGYDLGDLPEGAYATTMGNNGAQHIIDPRDNPTLGFAVDAESDGQPDVAAAGDDTGDGNDDEDGILLNNAVIANNPYDIRVIVTNADSAFLGDFDDAGEQIFTDQTFVADGLYSFNFTAPSGAVSMPYARFRFSTDAGLTPTGLASDGEVEDYQMTFIPADYGDLPSIYPTSLANNGPYHLIIAGGPVLGANVDDEFDGQPDVTATGDDTTNTPDDEDGVVLTSTIIAGEPLTFDITAANAAGAVLNAWADFNGDGDFDDTGEQIFADEAVANGTNSYASVVPSVTLSDTINVRFRLSTDTGLVPTGAATDGEVEDYQFAPTLLDFGDLPDTSTGGLYLTTVADNGPRHVILDTNNPTLGASIDDEKEGVPSTNADGDDTADGSDDEDGATFSSAQLIPGETVNVTVNATGVDGSLNAWIDFNDDGDFSDAGEQIATDLAITAGGNQVILVTVPLDAPQGITTYARFRSSSQTGLAPSGLAADGEVEDYALPIAQLDYGDLPDTTAPTLYASNGARHVIADNNPTLGLIVDNEDDGVPSATADGDDLATGDDEDGIILPALIPGEAISVTVAYSNPTGSNTFLNAWVDIDGDGVLDQIATDTAVPPGSGTIDIPIAVPAGATETDAAYARFRISSQAGLSLNGLAVDGEVEDYVTSIRQADYGDLPDASVTSPLDYPTTQADNGPRHGILSTGNPILGAIVDAESDGAPATNADGDDMADGSDDEDGITFSTMIPGEVLYITTTASGADGLLNAWLDLNQDGDFDDDAEQIAINRGIAAGDSYEMIVNVPITLNVSIPLYARFRFSNQEDLTPNGVARNGEVEDYLIEVQSTASLALKKVLLSPADGLAVMNETVTFTLQITNTGLITITELNLSDAFDANYLTFNSASITPDTIAAGTLSWVGTNDGVSPATGSLQNELPLGPGEQFTITVEFTATKP
ncbi:carboxypeptidase regulatory-like domain-containing protein [Chloroflexi bacterium TSY]|nr:carboxypeptidase regulatory-like domain-containing protein [Chloroflexi bacterium TSY]